MLTKRRVATTLETLCMPWYTGIICLPGYPVLSSREQALCPTQCSWLRAWSSHWSDPVPYGRASISPYCVAGIHPCHQAPHTGLPPLLYQQLPNTTEPVPLAVSPHPTPSVAPPVVSPDPEPPDQSTTSPNFPPSVVPPNPAPPDPIPFSETSAPLRHSTRQRKPVVRMDV